MAGLGSVEDRVAAYRGNPAPLQQRYQMSQDLLDLLALQKIKSEKDAAARQMQLAMGQQQAAQGMEPETIAKQREKEVMELTKNELAQQRGDTAQQQQAQQQGAMQKLMSGIAAAPGAQSAAAPKAMATGGIVAFADGGSTDKKPLDEEAQRELAQARGDREAMLSTIKKLAAAGYDVATLIPRGLMGAFESGITRPLRALGVPLPYLPESAYGGDRKSMTPMMDKIRRQEAQAAQPDQSAAETARLEGAAAPAAPAAPTVPPPAAPTVSGIATPRPAAPAAPGVPAAPAAAPGAPAGGLASLVDKTAEGMMTQDPEARQKAMEDRIRAAYALTPEQKAVYEQGIAQRQKMFDEAYDPERQQREGLKQYLLGAGGRRYGEFAGGAKSAMGYDEEQRQAKLKDFEAMQKSREGLVSLEREGIKPSIEGGLKALEVGEAGRRTGLEAGTRRVEGALDRDSRERISREGNRIQAMIAQATRDQTLEIRRQGFLGDINKTETRALSDLQKGPIGKAIAGLEQMKAMNPKGFAKEQQQQLDDLNRQLQDAEQVIRAQMDVYREQLGGFGGKGGAKLGSSMSPEDRALVEKYSKGK